MALPDDTLLVCFIGEPDREPGDEHPRVLVWHNDGPLDEVRLSARSRRLLAELATPPVELPAHLSGVAAERRLAASLAASLPQWSAQELRDKVGYSRSQEWRLRGDLESELAELGLADRIVGDARGRVGLRGTVTDAATLYAAMRDGRADDAAQLLRSIAREHPERLVLTPPRGWPERAVKRVEEALGEAVAQWRADPSPQASAESTSLALVPRPLPVVARRIDRRYVRRRTARRLAAALLLIAAAATPLYLSLTAPEPRARPIPDSVAGPWPDGESSALANLTRAIPFDASETAASTGDVLLLRQRFRVGTATGIEAEPIEASFEYTRELANSVYVSLAVSGADIYESASVTIDGVEVGERVRPIPGTARLLDVDGVTVRRVPDVEEGRPLPLKGLRRGRVYFVSTRLRVGPPPDGARGELGNRGGDCDKGNAYASQHRVSLGDTATCHFPLENWGPRSLRRTTFRVTQSSGNQIGLKGAIASPEADPRRETVLGGFLDLSRETRTWRAEYVPGSARVRDSDGTRRVSGNPLRQTVDVGEIRATPNIVVGVDAGAQLLFEIRVVSAISRRRG